MSQSAGDLTGFSFPTGMWLGNTQRAAATTFDVENPATGEVIAQVADADSADWFAALDRAVSAQEQWAEVSPRHRSEILSHVFTRVMEQAEQFAQVIHLEMGKPLAEARGEVAYGAEYFRWFAEEAVRIPGRFGQAPAGNGHMAITRTPVGPVLAITPWNFPLAMATRKIAPALAAGCPIIVKPAHETPLTMLLLGKVVAESNLPDGLVSIIPTTKAANMSAELMADPRLRKITFTGSTPVGRQLVRQSADNLLRTSMELGGNAPFVIADDADLDLVLTCAMQAKMRNGGQACIAANRFLVQDTIADAFVARLTDAMRDAEVGPIITDKQRSAIAGLVDAALADGATATTGGIVPNGPGYFYPPTVLVGVPADSAILHTEIFGPVATVTTFSDLDDGIRMANDTEFGLAAYGFSQDIHRAQHLAESLHAGMVGINRGAISEPAAPFGGIKQSGFGREGGTEGIDEYLDVKYVAF